MHIEFAARLRRDWPRKMVGGLTLLLAATATSCKDPGYRTEVYPGSQGQYTVQRVPETPHPAGASAIAQTPPSPSASGAPAPGAAAAIPAAAPSTAPVDENLSQVEAIWPKLSDSDKALLLETAKHLEGQK